MYQLTAKKIFTVLVCAASVSAVHLLWTNDFSNRATCSSPGQIVCSSNCSTVQVCLGDDDGQYTPTDVVECESGMRCNASTANCVETSQSDCHPVNTSVVFTCHDSGAFPDPYDCSEYHVCLGPAGPLWSAFCAEGSAWNPLTYDCSLTTSDRVCTEGPITPCSRAGELGVVPENPSIYYICAVSGGELVPQMKRCRGGEIFDVNLAQCRKGSSPDQPTSGGNCTTQLQTAADPTDCTRYYRCGPDNKWLLIQCADEYHYDSATGGCANGSCQNRFTHVSF